MSAARGGSGKGAEPAAPAETKVQDSADGVRMRLVWRGRLVLEAPLLRGMSGRLRAGIVLGVRVCRDPALREEAARRVLRRLEAGR